MSELVLGIDPGLTRCGYGLITRSSSRQVRFVEVGVLQSPTTMELGERLISIGSQLEEIIKKHKPDQIAIERVFSQQNLKSVMSIAQITGVIVFLSQKQNIPVSFYTPTEVKAAVTGTGRASKEQVKNMVVRLLKLKEAPKLADAADALAIAITAAWRGPEIATASTETKAQQQWRTAEQAAKQRRR